MSRVKRSAVYRNVERTMLSVEVLSRAAKMAPSGSTEELDLHQQLLRANKQLQLACTQAAHNYREGSGAQLFADLAAMTLGSLVEIHEGEIEQAQAAFAAAGAPSSGRA